MISSIIFLGLPTSLFSANLNEMYSALRHKKLMKKKMQKELQSHRHQQHAYGSHQNIHLLQSISSNLATDISDLQVQIEKIQETQKLLLAFLQEIEHGQQPSPPK